MNNEGKKELEILTMKIGELTEAVHMMWLGLQSPETDMEYALSCIALFENALKAYHEKLLQVIQIME